MLQELYEELHSLLKPTGIEPYYLINLFAILIVGYWAKSDIKKWKNLKPGKKFMIIVYLISLMLGTALSVLKIFKVVP